MVVEPISQAMPVGLVLQTGIKRDQCRRSAIDGFMNRGGDLPVTLAQNLLHLAIKIGVDAGGP
jgi:hypothetical protein